jgi:hypothetical protein
MERGRQPLSNGEGCLTSGKFEFVGESDVVGVASLVNQFVQVKPLDGISSD